MKIIADFHIHSKFSRACSKDLVLSKIDETCRVKGVDIVGTGDFTHPGWMKMIEEELIPQSPLSSSNTQEGDLYQLKGGDGKIKFILTSEVALIYKDKGKCRRIHLVIHAPSIEAAKEFNSCLEKSGFNIKSDGRPILGMSAPKLCKALFEISPEFLVYPAHIWTPWFSVFGSKSGFDRLEDCFDEYTDQIYAYETGLSSDPEMNWRLSALDRLTLLSNSDAHSLPNIGREATVFDLEKVTYSEINEAIRSGDSKKIVQTLEFYPEEGMYHFDGHRDCGLSLTPVETKKNKGICSVCKKPLTIGVVYRIDELADRPEGFRPAGKPGFVKLVELDKIIAEALGIKSRSSKEVQVYYGKLTKALGSELDILMNRPLAQIVEHSLPLIGEGVKRVREGKLSIKPGYDGQYGEVKILTDNDRRKQEKML